MLEKLPEVQLQHSIHQSPLGAGDPTQPCSHPLMALCLWQPVSPCALSLFLPLNPFASRVREGGLQNIMNVPKLKPREVVALRWSPQTSFQPQQQAEPEQLPRRGRSKLFLGEVAQKGVEILYRIAKWLFEKGDTLFPKNCFMLNPWKLTGNQLAKNHGKSCKVLWVTCFQAELSITQPLPASGYVTVSSELKCTPTHFCTMLQIRHILRN